MLLSIRLILEKANLKKSIFWWEMDIRWAQRAKEWHSTGNHDLGKVSKLSWLSCVVFNCWVEKRREEKMIFLLSSKVVLLCTQTSTWMGKGKFCEVALFQNRQGWPNSWQGDWWQSWWDSRDPLLLHWPSTPLRSYGSCSCAQVLIPPE